MWGWLFRRCAPSPQATEPRILVRVIGLLSPGYARVVVGPGVGMLNGGSEQDWPVEWLPPQYRRPNAEMWWVGQPSRRPPRLEPATGAEPDLASATGNITDLLK